MTILKTKQAETEAPVDAKKSDDRIDNDAGFWLNRTKSGKGVIIVIEEQAFISSLANIKEFMDGSRKGVKFNHLKPLKD